MTEVFQESEDMTSADAPTEAPALLDLLFAGVLDCAAHVDRDCRYRAVNAAFLEFVGRPRHEVVGHAVRDILGEVVHQSCEQMIEQLRPGETLRREGWLDCGPRGMHYLGRAITALPVAGGVSGFIVILRDLTELHRQQQDIAERIEAQKASEAYHAAIIRTALDAVVVIDEAGIVVDFNPAAVSIFGYSREAAVGSQIADLIIPHALRSAHDTGMTSYLETGVSRVLGKRLELEALRVDGTQIPVELTIADVTLGAKRLFAAHLRDLTAVRAAQAEILRQGEALHQKDKLAALGSLLAGVAHELNNPLSIVIGQAMMLRERITEAATHQLAGEELAQRSAKIESAANRCAKIVRSFLDMARQRKTERQAVPLPHLVREALDLLKYNLHSSAVIVETDVAENLPSLWVDRDQLHQVLINLVINAHQALEEKREGKRRIHIAAEARTEDGVMLLSVSDNGPGIAPDIRSRIFDPYFTTKPQGFGTGIGLAVSRGLIEAHGGALDLDDRPGGGARFVIRLPLALGQHSGESTAPADTVPVPVVSNKRLLVVDDEADIADLLSDMAGQLGFNIVIADSGQSAIARLEQGDFSPTAILCDIHMPGGDGPGFYDWLQKARPELTTRIAFVTGDTLGPAAGRFLARCGCPVIEKPFTPQDIRRILHSLIVQDE
ncbi:hybrid sensor histidine kinase/response regulator [Pararhizobium sp. O133]|uniref:hybrid sensor histidine kinase/response regulator n=1 Tax=Pararhizobium sp. O133 TaxID=3449278 RepID=UPI003F688091